MWWSSLSISFPVFFLVFQCSVTCGRGYQARFIKCAEKVTQTHQHFPSFLHRSIHPFALRLYIFPSAFRVFISCLPNKGHCREIQRARWQKVPPCSQTYGGAPAVVCPVWVPCSCHTSGPAAVEHTSSHSSPTHDATRMALISLVAGKSQQGMIKMEKTS